MAQVKIYGHQTFVNAQRKAISDCIHDCLCEVFRLPIDKRFQRFFALADEDFIHPPARSPQYLIIEIMMFEGRSVHAKKSLINLLFTSFEQRLDLAPMDLEITLVETPRHNWGIRGLPGDELSLDYRINPD